MHFGIISAPVPGHLYPCCMLSTKIKEQGHKITVYNIPDSEAFVKTLGFDFYRIAEKEFPLGSWHQRWNLGRTGSNIWRDTRILKAHIEIAEIMLRDLPAILEQEKIDVLIVDHLQPQGSSLAEKLNIPFVTICSILPLHNDSTGTVPAAFAWWLPKNNLFNHLVNRLSHKMVHFLSYSYLKIVNKYRKKWGMLPINDLESSFSEIAQIGVIPTEIDFPRPQIQNYYSVGPAITKRSKVEFPWHKLDGRPLVYASMGTIRNKIGHIYSIIINVFARLPQLQLVLSKGAWNGNGMEINGIPENVILVDFAPQLEILEKAKLCITHAGPGTILESVYYGVPLIAIPIADDQPAMAARVEYHKLGIRIPYRRLTEKRLHAAILKVLGSEEISNSGNQMSKKIKRYGGADWAAGIVFEKLGFK